MKNILKRMGIHDVSIEKVRHRRYGYERFYYDGTHHLLYLGLFQIYWFGTPEIKLI